MASWAYSGHPTTISSNEVEKNCIPGDRPSIDAGSDIRQATDAKGDQVTPPICAGAVNTRGEAHEARFTLQRTSDA